MMMLEHGCDLNDIKPLGTYVQIKKETTDTEHRVYLLTAYKDWIPCSTRLPEYGLDVLVYVKSWEAHIQVAHIQYDGTLWEMSDGEFYFSQSDVTHWMPCPNPPESEMPDGCVDNVEKKNCENCARETCAVMPPIGKCYCNFWQARK